MKNIIATTVVLSLSAAPSFAEEDGFSLMEEGFKLFFKGMTQEMEPAIEDLRGLAEQMGPQMRQFMQEMGPAMAQIMGKMGDITQYHAPEMLPNGDIILRRKEPLPPGEQAPEPLKEGEIDL